MSPRPNTTFGRIERESGVTGGLYRDDRVRELYMHRTHSGEWSGMEANKILRVLNRVLGATEVRGLKSKYWELESRGGDVYAMSVFLNRTWLVFRFRNGKPSEIRYDDSRR